VAAGSKAGSWQGSGGALQPAWLFRSKAIPLISTKSSEVLQETVKSQGFHGFSFFHKQEKLYA